MRCTYIISLNQNDFHVPFRLRSEKYLGKLEGNRTSYHLYDRGHSPAFEARNKDLFSDSEDEEMPYDSVLRKEMVAVHFPTCKRGRGDMLVAVPEEGRDKHLLKRLTEQNTDHGIVLESMPCVRRRLSISSEIPTPLAPSSKNFELKRRGVIDDGFLVKLGMGRVGEDRFEMAVRAPLSPFQAFGVALAQLDHETCARTKLARKFSM